MRPLIIYVLFALCLPALAQEEQALTPEQAARQALQERYLACVGLVEQSPREAVAEATDWIEDANIPAATHCLALAQVALDQFPLAVTNFERVARDAWDQGGLLSGLEPGGEDVRLLVAGFWAQAGNAALLGQDLARADNALTEAINLLPPTESGVKLELYVDRARVRAGLQDYGKAVQDLDIAQSIDPQRLDVLLYRASALRRMDKLEPALLDINVVLTGQPEWADAYLERGQIHALLGDEAQARSDWLSAVRFGEANGPAARAAKANLALLDEDIGQ